MGVSDPGVLWMDARFTFHCVIRHRRPNPACRLRSHMSSEWAETWSRLSAFHYTCGSLTGSYIRLEEYSGSLWIESHGQKRGEHLRLP